MIMMDGIYGWTEILFPYINGVNGITGNLRAVEVYRHNAGANYLFLDMHTQWLKGPHPEVFNDN